MHLAYTTRKGGKEAVAHGILWKLVDQPLGAAKLPLTDMHMCIPSRSQASITTSSCFNVHSYFPFSLLCLVHLFYPSTAHECSSSPIISRGSQHARNGCRGKIEPPNTRIKAIDVNPNCRNPRSHSMIFSSK